MRTKAVPQGDGTYRVSGQKIFITYGEHEMTQNIIHLVLARTPDAPEGVKGISKGWRERYKLQRFGRGGHIKLALRTRTPIIPVSIVGSDEAHPMLGQSQVLAKMMGLPYMPITPTFPWLGPLGLMPLPTRWRIVFGQPLALDGYEPAQADDEVLVGRLNERLRSTIQETLDRTLRQRAGA